MSSNSNKTANMQLFAFNRNIKELFRLKGEYNLCWKRIDGTYYAGNDHLSQHLGLPSSSITGKDDFDFGPAENAKNYQKDDRQVIINDLPTTFISNVVYFNEPEKCYKYFDFKAPLKNAANQTIGILALSYLIKPNNMAHLSQAINTIYVANRLKTSHNHSLPPLTPREIQTLKLLIKGKTAKEIGKILKISFRTVEEYVQQLKIKFNCYRRSELISKTLDSGIFYIER